jgi:hypothetical protein
MLPDCVSVEIADLQMGPRVEHISSINQQFAEQ